MMMMIVMTGVDDSDNNINDGIDEDDDDDDVKADVGYDVNENNSYECCYDDGEGRNCGFDNSDGHEDDDDNDDVKADNDDIVAVYMIEVLLVMMKIRVLMMMLKPDDIDDPVAASTPPCRWSASW